VKGRDGSYIPFNIESSTTFDNFCILIGQKTNSFPGLLRLQYRLDTDKPKSPWTSIRSEEELKMFISKMRPLIVPAKLANGQKSTRVLKAFTVYLQDVSEDAAKEGTAAPTRSDKGSSKKVSRISYTCVP
jgi:hypothetical protein